MSARFVVIAKAVQAVVVVSNSTTVLGSERGHAQRTCWLNICRLEELIVIKCECVAMNHLSNSVRCFAHKLNPNSSGDRSKAQSQYHEQEQEHEEQQQNNFAQCSTPTHPPTHRHTDTQTHTHTRNTGMAHV